MYSPTTSPYGYSSFPKEENGDTTDWLNCHQIWRRTNNKRCYRLL